MHPPFLSEPEERHSFGPPTRPFHHLTDVTAELAVPDYFTAAVDASDALGHFDSFIKGAVGDFGGLLSLNLGSHPQAGQPVDPPPTGRSARRSQNSPGQ